MIVVKGGLGMGSVWIDVVDGLEFEECVVKFGVNDGVMVEVMEGFVEGDSICEFVFGFVVFVEEICYEVLLGVE